MKLAEREFAKPKLNPALIAPHIGHNFKSPTHLDYEAQLPPEGFGLKVNAASVPLKPVGPPIATPPKNPPKQPAFTAIKEYMTSSSECGYHKRKQLFIYGAIVLGIWYIYNRLD